MELQLTPEELTIPAPRIRTMFSVFHLGCLVDLKSLSRRIRNAEHIPTKGVIVRLREPRSSAYIFASGKVVVSGPSSEAASRIASRRIGRMLHRLGLPVRFLDFQIENIVATTEARVAISLSEMSANTPGAFFDPRKLCCVVYRIPGSLCSALIFKDGKIILNGERSEVGIAEAWEKLQPLILQYGKQSSTIVENNGEIPGGLEPDMQI